MNILLTSSPQQISARSNQRGVALVVALVLLVVVTLVGLAAIRGTTLQQKMTSNFYDREVAFQSAEAALRAAATAIQTNASAITRNCGPGGVACPEVNPFDNTSLTPQTVGTGTGSGEFSASANSASQPQYIIENMGAFPDPQNNTGFNQTANAAQYGAQGVSTTAIYYRITARSGDPLTIGDRAVVTLQAWIKV